MMPYSLAGERSQVGNSTILRYTSTGRNATIRNTTIGIFCSIPWNVTIGITSHPIKHLTTYPFPYISRFQFVEEDVRLVEICKVGADIWIEANTIILAGVRIGNGAVIGVGSIVTKDVSVYSAVAGFPAKKIRRRFNDRHVRLLEEIGWWNWDIDKRNMVFIGQELTEDTLDTLQNII